MKWLQNDTLFAFGVVALVLLLIIPLPSLLLDILLCFSLVFAVMTLLLTLYVENPLEFNSFPSLLLFLTLYRLGLNIASTRMILSKGEAGKIIATFGDFVTAGNAIVGLIIFILVTLINFIVVTKGAGRVAEVAARFTLEALPGKQMAIDSDLQAGSFTQIEAKEAREKISLEAHFFGAMDGASKFVRGDAIAGIVITLVNLFGGLIIGLISLNLTWKESLSLYTHLTIGDGLVTQMPALLVSVASGIIVTRASKESLGKALPKQLFNHPKVLWITATIVYLLACVPGMPFFVMVAIGSALLLASFSIGKSQKKSEVLLPEKREEKKVEEVLFIAPIEVTLGANLLHLAEPLFETVPKIRQIVAARLGIILPMIQVKDQLNQEENGYRIKIKGITLFQGVALGLEEIVEGVIKGLEEHAYLLLTRQDVAKLCDAAKLYDEAVVDELIPRKMNIGQILKVFQNLLREKISIKDTVSILEVLADNTTGEPPDTDHLTECVRRALSKSILENLIGESKELCAITLDPKVEQMISASVKKVGAVAHPHLRPQTVEKIRSQLADLVKQDRKCVVLTTAQTRMALHKLLEKHVVVPVLSYQEVEADIKIEPLGNITTDVLI